MAQEVDGTGRYREPSPSTRRSSGELVFLNETQFSNMLNQMNCSADDLQLTDDIYINSEAAKGTDTLVKIEGVWKETQEMTNRYKSFMSVDVTGLLIESINNIKSAAQTSGDAINLQE